MLEALALHSIIHASIGALTYACAVIFILRLYSIYAKSNTVLYGFTGLLVLELAVKIVSDFRSFYGC